MTLFLSTSCSTKLYPRNSRYLLASWPLTLSVPPAEQPVPYGILLPCNLEIHHSAPMNRACLVCFPSLWFLLTLCFLLSSVLSPSCTFPFSQLCMVEVQLLSLSYRQQRTSYIDLHQAAPFPSLKSVLLLSSWVTDAFVFTHLLSLHTYRAYICFYFQKTRSIYLLNFHNLLLPL